LGAAAAAAPVEARGVRRSVGGCGRDAKAAAAATVPYRLLCESVSSPGELDRHFLR